MVILLNCVKQRVGTYDGLFIRVLNDIFAKLSRLTMFSAVNVFIFRVLRSVNVPIFAGICQIY